MHKSTGGYEFWDSIKDEVIDKYINQKRTSNSIGEDYGCSGSTVDRHLERWGIERRKERCNSKYSFDIHFFDVIDTEEKAYILGLLLADGHISKNNAIMLTLKDIDIIKKYLVAIHSDTPIKIDRYGNYAANITSVSMANRLRDIGLSNRKSYYIDLERVLSNIPKHLEHHFVRGLFDGDGSIKIYHYKYLKKPQLHFGYTGLLNVVEYVRDYFGIKTKMVKESDITYTCVSSCRSTICDVYKILYKDATIYIDRKYKTFKEIINMNEPSTTIMGGTQ